MLDHFRNPENYGKPEAVSHSAEGKNQLCGDEITVYLKLDDDFITDVGFEASGCALLIASASMMTKAVKAKSIEEFEQIKNSICQLTGNENSAVESELGDLSIFEEIRNIPARRKCVLLPWITMQSAIDGENETISTE